MNECSKRLPDGRSTKTGHTISILHLMNRETHVYILGAGCSYDGQNGYPLAKQFIGALEEYLRKIQEREDCKKTRTAVEDTIALLKQSGSGSWQASTIDKLVDHIYKGRCDDEIRALKPNSSAHIVGLRYASVRNAKIATAASFLDLEKKARNHLGERYRRFIEGKIFNQTGTSSWATDRLKKSSACVLSFNYDRLFEHSFFSNIADTSTKDYAPYSEEVLNSGHGVFGKPLPISPDRFSFLKVHGCIGARCGDLRFDQDVSHVDQIDRWTEVSVTDSLFFQSDGPEIIEPFIAFPYEKDYVVSGKDNAYPFSRRIVRVWEEAAKRLELASEISVIGYSFDPPDCMHLVNLLKRPNNCRRIVIQNLPLECERIKGLLQDHGIATRIDVRPEAF